MVFQLNQGYLSSSEESAGIARGAGLRTGQNEEAETIIGIVRCIAYATGHFGGCEYSVQYIRQ